MYLTHFIMYISTQHLAIQTQGTKSTRWACTSPGVKCQMLSKLLIDHQASVDCLITVRLINPVYTHSIKVHHMSRLSFLSELGLIEATHMPLFIIIFFGNIMCVMSMVIYCILLHAKWFRMLYALVSMSRSTPILNDCTSKHSLNIILICSIVLYVYRMNPERNLFYYLALSKFNLFPQVYIND
jgi:hypothetical protein